MWQGRFVWALLLSGVVLFAVILVLLYQNQRQVRRGWAEHGDVLLDRHGTRKRAVLDAAYVLVILALFLVGLTQLMLSIRW